MAVQWSVQVGAGSHKVIYKAWDNSDGKLVAWNVVSIVNLSQAEQERLKAEVKILSNLSHPRLIHFCDSWTTDTEVVFITAIVGSGDLRRCDGVTCRQTPRPLLCVWGELHRMCPCCSCPCTRRGVTAASLAALARGNRNVSSVFAVCGCARPSGSCAVVGVGRRCDVVVAGGSSNVVSVAGVASAAVAAGCLSPPTHGAVLLCDARLCVCEGRVGAGR